jgi:hypothetical protein
MWDAPGLINKQSRLSHAVVRNAIPTEPMYAIFEDFLERFEVQQNQLNHVIEEKVGPMLSR